MVQQRRAVPNLLGSQQEEVDYLWPMHLRLPMEPAGQPFSQHSSLGSYPFPHSGEKDARLG
jgi:hypothetical protein